ncbi:MAG: TrkA family potassium uptake protein [Planctomycetia bacterium]|nr:MAG: TrkA family potassium uptake protein [Planctomycetia bacterium]
MKQVVVVGLGQFGGHLARTLVHMGCEVLAIDADERRVNEVRDEVHRALIGDARDFNLLKSVIGGTVAEAAVSLGEKNIEPSILCTLHLAKLGISNIRSTARNNDHAQILRAVGATEVIYPERETAERTARRIANPDLRDMFSLAEDYRILEIQTPKRLLNKTLAELSLRQTYDLLVLAIRESDQAPFRFLPAPDTVLRQGQVLMVLGRELDIARFAGL